MSFRISTGLANRMLGLVGNMFTDGGMTSVAEWTAGAGTTISSAAGGATGNALKIVNDGAAAGSCYRDFTVLVGHKYSFSIKHKDGTAGGATYTGKIQIGKTTDADYYLDSGTLTDSSWTDRAGGTLDQPYYYEIIPETTTVRVTLLNVGAGAGDNSFWDDAVFAWEARSFQECFKDCVIKVYTGSQPATADTAPSGTLLFTLYSDGSSAGLEWDDATGGTISKKSTETWTGTAVAAGTAGWFRICTPGDLGTTNTTDVRADGSIATSGAQINMTGTTVAVGSIQALSSLQFTLPMV